MERRTLVVGLGALAMASAGCVGTPSRGTESPSDGNESDSDGPESSAAGRTFLEVRRVDETADEARIADGDCVRQSPILEAALDEAVETDRATTELGSTEEEELRETLDGCYESEHGTTYIRDREILFKVVFVKQQ